MRSRYLLACLAAIVLAVQSGCHCSGCWPCGKNWCGSQCGECIWHEWFSLPPDCRDPCTNCGSFCGPNNRFLRRGVFAQHGGAVGPYYDQGYTPTDTYRPASQASPQQAPQQAAPREELPSASDIPGGDEFRTGEELPPLDSSSDAGFDAEYGRPASYDRPFDSTRRSRTLGRPYPARRYVR